MTNRRLRHALIQAFIFLFIYFWGTFYGQDLHIADWVLAKVFIYLFILCLACVYLYKIVLSYAVSIGNVIALIVAEVIYRLQLADNVQQRDLYGVYIWFALLCLSLFVAYAITLYAEQRKKTVGTELQE